ncbi:hypothetical protein CC86DRAFT_4911 [Ophiobolus disseminans]|uniref:TATA element modulatory factor 1 TATA binding domain-containing protein n=1 Tax=Ophiobolus disseminans TaxID=1469910 RepID=A0A6A7AIF7_9PLEO|nr:hypothetical protein CC86DRAFT_4911 [Ophiobolus disseminans]
MSGKGWWNSAISGLESRLDTILAEDAQGNAKPKPGEAAPKPDAPEKAALDKKLAVEPASRNSSRSRPSSRLQDRLAKAVNKGTERSDSRASSDMGSRPESPALQGASTTAIIDSGRASLDLKTPEQAPEISTASKEDNATDTQESQIATSPRPSIDATVPSKAPPVPVASKPPAPLVSEQPTLTPAPMMSLPSIITPRTASPRQSIDSDVSRPSIDASTLAEEAQESISRDPDVLVTELAALQEAHEETVRSHRDELNAHLERIDALQSKLTYLAQQVSTSARAAASDADTPPTDKKLAEKDVQIASLMEEGQRLSKTEMKHLTTVKQLRAKALDHTKEITTLKQRLSKAEKSITEQSERAKRAEAAERAAQDKLKIVGKIEKDIELIRAEHEEAGMTINELRKQLNDALSRAESAEKRAQAGALEAEKRATALLKEDIENLRIEKKLAEDRAKRDLQASKDEAKGQQEKTKVTELELRGEIAVSCDKAHDRCMH